MQFILYLKTIIEMKFLLETIVQIRLEIRNQNLSIGFLNSKTSNLIFIFHYALFKNKGVHLARPGLGSALATLHWTMLIVFLNHS